MKSMVVGAAVFLACTVAGATGPEGALYDALGVRIGPVDRFGWVLAQVNGRMVWLVVRPMGQSQLSQVPPDYRAMTFTPFGSGTYWTQRDCTGGAFLFQTDDGTSGDTPATLILSGQGKPLLYTALPTSGPRSAWIQSIRQTTGTCFNLDELTNYTMMLKVESKIDLSTVFALPLSLR